VTNARVPDITNRIPVYLSEAAKPVELILVVVGKLDSLQVARDFVKDSEHWRHIF
jgi:hypothetical protein